MYLEWYSLSGHVYKYRAWEITEVRIINGVLKREVVMQSSIQSLCLVKNCYFYEV